jgi:hypothetical protein
MENKVFYRLSLSQAYERAGLSFTPLREMFTSSTGTPEQRAEAVRGKLRRLCGSDRPFDWKGLAIIDLVSL